MSLDADLAAIPVLVDEVRALRREVGELRAIIGDAGARWVTQTEWARVNGVSVDTAARKIAAGELEVRELGRTPLLGRDGKQLHDRRGVPRFRRMLRVRLTPQASTADVRRVAAEMTGPGATVAVIRPLKPAEARR